MLVVPADAYIERRVGASLHDVLRPAEHLAGDAFDIEDPLVTLGVQVTRPATEYGYLSPKLDRGADVGELDAYPLRRSRRSRSRARPRSSSARRAWPGTRASSCGDGAPSGRRSVASPASLQSLEPMVGAPMLLEWAYEADPAGHVDRPRGHGGRRPRRPGRDGRDGRRVVGPRFLDRAAGGHRGARRGCGRPARRDRHGRRGRPGRPPCRRPARGHRPARAR